MVGIIPPTDKHHDWGMVHGGHDALQATGARLFASGYRPPILRPGPLDGVLAPLRTLDVVGVRLGTMDYDDYELEIMEIGSL